MSLTKFKLSAYLWLAAAALVFVALTPILNQTQAVLISDAQVSASRSSSDTDGQTASPNPSSGFDQEEKVRQLLAKQYEQRFGDSEPTLRSALGLKGKIADFVGYHPRTQQWLIAESKATHINTATDQLKNTTQALLKMHPDAKIELRLFLDAKNFKLLESGGDVYGWRMNAQGHLGWIDGETKQWMDMVIEGIKVAVQRAP